MPNTVSTMISGVRQLCTFGSPPAEPTEEQLSTSSILTTLNDVETTLTNEATLSQQNQFLQSALLGVPGSREISFLQPNFSALVAVEYQVDPTYDRWSSLKIVNRVELNDAEDQGIYACAIYGTPPILAFNFIPSIMLPMFGFRAWYETAPTDQLPADTPRLNQAFLPLWKYQAAIICRTVYMGLPPSTVLTEQRNEMRAQYVRFANKSNDQRAMAKPAAYGTENLEDYYTPWRY